MKKLILLIISLFFLSSDLFAQTKSVNISVRVFNETIETKLPTTWRYDKAAFKQVRNGMYIIEFLPQKQNFDNWKEMFTIQGFNNLAVQDNMSSERLELMMQKSYKDLSPKNFVYKGKKQIKIGRHKAVVALMGCSNVPRKLAAVKKGEGEIGLYLFVKGKQDVYIIHKSWRTKAFKNGKLPIKQAEIDKWKDILISQTKFL